MLSEAESKIRSVLHQSEKWIKTENTSDIRPYFAEIQKRMSSSGGIIRNSYRCDEAALLANEMLLSLPGKIGAKDVKGLSECFVLMDHCLTHFIYLKAISYYLCNGGRSRGSYVVTDDKNNEFNSSLCEFDREIESRIIEVIYRDEILSFKRTQVRDIPEQDLWFEKVWKDYREDISPAG